MDNDTYADAGYDTAPTTNRTPTDRRSAERATDRPTMGDVSHTNPHTGEGFGDTVTFRRGTTVVVDGGTADAVPEPDGEDDAVGTDADGKPDDGEDAKAESADVEAERVVPASGGTMGDVSHEPPHDAPDPNAVYMRGGEGTATDSADDEETEE